MKIKIDQTTMRKTFLLVLFQSSILVKFFLAILLVISASASSVFAEEKPYSRLKSILTKLDSAFFGAIKKRDARLEEIKKIRESGRTIKADRLLEQLGTWEDFAIKTIPYIEKKYIRPYIGKVVTFEAPWNQIYEIKRVSFYNTQNVTITTPSDSYGESESETLVDKIQKIRKEIREVSKQLSRKYIKQEKIIVQKMDGWIRRYRQNPSKANSAKLVFECQKEMKKQAKYFKGKSKSKDAFSALVNCSLLLGFVGAIGEEFNMKELKKDVKERKQTKRKLSKELNCWQSLNNQLYTQSNHTKKIDSIIEQMQEYDPSLPEKEYRGNIVYRVRYKLVFNVSFSEKNKCLRKYYDIDLNDHLISLYATEKFTPIGAIIKGEKFTLKQLYNGPFMKRRMQAINKAIRQRLLMEQKIQEAKKELSEIRDHRLELKARLEEVKSSIREENKRTQGLKEQIKRLPQKIKEKEKELKAETAQIQYIEKIIRKEKR